MSRVVWITGLSGAGKTTLAEAVVQRLRAADRPCLLLDGDALREALGAEAATAANHGREARLALAMRYARLCRLLAQPGITVVIATISMFREVQAWNRRHLPGYLEVYLPVPVEELQRRDPKGIYRRFAAGELAHVAGLDLPVDEPEAPELRLDFEPHRTPGAAADRVMDLIDNLETTA